MNMPIMQPHVRNYRSHNVVRRKYGCKGDIQTGQLSSFIMYVSQILMSLMMLSMLFIMFVVSRASMQRIYEVLAESLQ